MMHTQIKLIVGLFLLSTLDADDSAVEADVIEEKCEDAPPRHRSIPSLSDMSAAILAEKKEKADSVVKVITPRHRHRSIPSLADISRSILAAAREEANLKKLAERERMKAESTDPLLNGERARAYFENNEARSGDIILFGPYGGKQSHFVQWRGQGNCWLAVCEFGHVGVVLKNPETGKFEVFHAAGGHYMKVLFTDIDEILAAGRTRIAIRKCKDVLDEEQIVSFIQEHKGKTYRPFKSMSGCIKKKWDALEDDTYKVNEKETEEAPLQETPGLICSELVAMFLNKMGIIDNAFLRWKRYLPRHFVYGTNFTNAERETIPPKALKKLLAEPKGKYRLIDRIPGQKEEHRFAYANHLTEIYSEPEL